jgi:hypothetical protein
VLHHSALKSTQWKQVVQLRRQSVSSWMLCADRVPDRVGFRQKDDGFQMKRESKAPSLRKTSPRSAAARGKPAEGFAEAWVAKHGNLAARSASGRSARLLSLALLLAAASFALTQNLV